MKSLAIVGSGVAGMACAYFLRNHFNIRIFEKNPYIGGHTNTVTVHEGASPVHIDTGFMVYNEVTYPNLTRLFDVLGVETKPTSMSFSVQHQPTGLEFAGTGLNGLFAQRRQLFNPNHYRLLAEINRFNNSCTEILDDPHFENHTVAAYLSEKSYSKAFADQYLVPMSSAVWSTPPDMMLQFPAVTLVRFFKNHGFLGLKCQHPWRTVAGGSRIYRDQIVSHLSNSFHVNQKIAHLHRSGEQLLVKDTLGNSTRFDKVIIATHADEALEILTEPTTTETNLLSAFSYQPNTATLHTDEAIMPKNRRAWCSWNYRVEAIEGGVPGASIIYWMNSLQNVSKNMNYFVSINDPGGIRSSKVIKRIEYTHPLFSTAAIQAQKHLPELNTNGSVFFCGSYFKYGFHEDALTSALEVCRLLKGGDPWF